MVILMRQPSKAVLILNMLFVILVGRIYCCHPASKKQCLSKETVAQLTTDKSLSFMKQNVIHCTNHSIHMMDCVDHWSPNHKKYIWPLKDHYEPLRKQANHSINKDKRRIRLDKSTLLTVDIIIDARCHHSWPYNPYHRYHYLQSCVIKVFLKLTFLFYRIADCLIFIIPALQNYIDFHFPKRKTPWARTRTKIAMIVDEASEMLCENGNKKTDFEGREVDVSKDDQCILWDFQMLFRSRYYFQCVKISIFHKSIHWYRKLQHTTVVAKEVIWLQAQKNPFALGSGFMNVKDPDYSEYLKDFRRIFLNGFCRYCAVKHDSSPVGNAWTSISHTNVSYRNPQNLIVLIQRQPGMGRDIIQHNALYSAINNSIEIVNNMFDTSSSKNPKYELAVYRGNESLCETIAMFWTSKIVGE